ncbi:MAG: TylF/MycF family methyltransferase [Nitrospira sp.]|nr:TylF/MycF family methyltransferase [Nitrospira sp.]
MMLTKLLRPVRDLKNRWRMDSDLHPASDVGDEKDQDCETIRFVQPYTMTSPERIRALCSAVRYIEEAGLEGAVVECGVWRGGSMMAVARTLLNRGATDRELFLFDTFEGMTEPGPHDVAITGESAESLLKQASRTEEDRIWCYAPIEQVARTLALTHYPQERIHLIPGRVENTLATAAPERIALLRLDTDWYESTRCELEVLFPRLRQGGVLLIDDYGHWRGARRAVDEYVSKHRLKLFLHPIDYTGRIAVKAFE